MASRISVLLVLIFAFAMLLRIEAYRRCPARSQTAEEVRSLRESCKYGVFEDNCSRYHCAKGPREFCGNPNSMFHSVGQCGDGLKCACGRCMGCSSLVWPLECFDQVCNED